MSRKAAISLADRKVRVTRKEYTDTPPGIIGMRDGLPGEYLAYIEDDGADFLYVYRSIGKRPYGG